MKTPLRYMLILVLIQLPLFLVAQKKSFHLVNEFGISGNLAGIDNFTGSSFGYSISLYHSGSEKKHISWVYGIEFNSTNIYQNSIRLNRWYWYNDTFISTKSVSLPLLIRVGITPNKNKLKLFGETGVRLDCKIWTHMKGTSDFSSGSPDVAPPTSNYFDESADKTTKAFSVLPSVGLGLSYRLSKVDLILKTDYRFGSGFILYFSRPVGDVSFYNLSLQLRLNHK